MGMIRSVVLSQHDAAKAVGHPLRAAILERLADREASPARLARELNEPVSNVSYHVIVLHNLGALVLVRQQQVRGAVEHTYTATVRILLSQAPL